MSVFVGPVCQTGSGEVWGVTGKGSLLSLTSGGGRQKAEVFSGEERAMEFLR